MKTCSKCKQIKDNSSFGKQKNSKDGYRSCCKECKQKQDRSFYSKNSNRIIERCLKYQKQNKSLHNAYKAQKRALKLLATPNWLTKEHKKNINTEYQLATWCSQVTGLAYHVDHIVPLKGSKVCGLHVPWNLQVILAKDNITKGNRFEY